MNDIYCIADISKQAMWKYRRRQETCAMNTDEVVGKMQDIRQRHRRMGCRRLYYQFPRGYLPVGRDIFEQIGFANGFKLKRKRSAIKTTWSQRVEVYPNLIEGMVLTGVNQVWQSDIFYLSVEQDDFYGIAIEDVYSRKLLALHLSLSLRAEESVRALKKAIKARKGQNLKGCIFHSDRGSQYISEAHKELLRSERMKISMGKMPQENAYVERIHGTLKYEYFFEHELSKGNLQKMARKFIRWYNDERPHSSLGMMSPTAFERHSENLVENQRPQMKIYQGFAELSTKSGVINKKKKEAKKKKFSTFAY